MTVFHGAIVSLDPDNREYDYLVAQDGRIAYLGNALPEEYARGHSTVELGEGALLPAFGDGHIHFSNWALTDWAYFDVREAQTIQELQEIIRGNLARYKKGQTVLAFGASRHQVREKRLISKAELDAVCPDRPLIIICYDGHSALCNSRMLAKLPARVKKLRGYGAQRGYISHEAYFAATDYAASQVALKDLVASIIRGYDTLAENGVGMIHAVEGVGFPLDLDFSLVNWIAKARARRNQFQTRLFFQTLDVGKVLKRKLPRIGGCFATAVDGCFGACDAALAAPYSHDPANRGALYHSEVELAEFVLKAHRAGLQIELHAIGDAAVARAVEALKSALKDTPREDHRHTLIHACLIRPEDLQKIADLDIGITLQPGFLISPLEPVSYLEEILGSRLQTSSPLKSILQAGIRLSGGSDAPVTHPDPIEGIYGACNHPYDPAQSLSVVEALKMFTYEVARASFDEQERGSLEKGKIADMVILNRNPLKLAPRELRSLKVERLYLQGRAYEPGMGTAGMVWDALRGRNESV
ncbi:MAG: amidohydrolase [Desulfobacterales bacterium]